MQKPGVRRHALTENVVRERERESVCVCVCVCVCGCAYTAQCVSLCSVVITHCILRTGMFFATIRLTFFHIKWWRQEGAKEWTGQIQEVG